MLLEAIALEIRDGLLTYWASALMGLVGLGLRVSRVGLPNGGAEPRNVVIHAWRLFRVWIESTGWALVAGVIAVSAKETAPVDTTSPAIVGLAVFVGAAWSDTLSRSITNPAGTLNAALEWFGRLLDLWSRFLKPK